MNPRDEQILRAQALARAFEDHSNDDVLNVLGPALRDALAEVWPLPDAADWGVWEINLDGLRDGDPESDPDDEPDDCSDPFCFPRHEPKVIAETRAVLNARIAAAKDIDARWLERFGGVL